MMKYLLFFCSLFFCSCFSNRQSLDIDRGGLIVNLDSIEVAKNGADCYSQNGHAVTVLTWQS